MSSLPPTCPQCQSPTDHLDAKNRFCPQCRFPLMVVANKYRLVKLLAEGGFGNVYLAHHIHLLEDSARVIKVIRSEVMNQPGMETRFFREVRITASLSQKNEHIVRIYDDFGEEQGLGYYYVMEYLEGYSLYHLMSNPFDLQQALHIFDQLCDGIAEAHRASVIHRDLKPDNIILLQKGQLQDFVKVLDFGIAKPLKGSTVQTRLTQGALGTPFYMSPEQCLAKDVSPESDIYAMGVILYEMLAGRLPFNFEEDAELFAILHAHITAPPIPLNTYRPNLPQGLEEIILRAMAKQPEARYRSVEEFRDALRPFIDLSAGYASLTSSSRIRAIAPHTPPPSVAPVRAAPGPGTQSVQAAIIPSQQAPDVPVPAGGVPSGHVPSGALPPITGHPSTNHPLPSVAPATPPPGTEGGGTREWNRDDLRAPVAPTGLPSSASYEQLPQSSQSLSPHPGQPFSTGNAGLSQELNDLTLPEARPVDARLIEHVHTQQRPSKTGPILVFMLGLLLAAAGGGAWYWFQFRNQNNTLAKTNTPPLRRSKTLTPPNQPNAPDSGTPTQTGTPIGISPRPVVPPDDNPPPVRPPQPARRAQQPPVRRRKRRRRRRRRRPKQRRPKPRRTTPKRVEPVRPPVRERRDVPPRIRPPERRRLVAMARPNAKQVVALVTYNKAGTELLRLFRRRRPWSVLLRQARRVFQLHQGLSFEQKQLPQTHTYQTLAHLQRVRHQRTRLKRLRWMSNPYTTQRDESKRVKRIYFNYFRRIRPLFLYTKSPYFPCAFFFMGEAHEKLSSIFKDALHAPLPPPGFRHSPVSMNEFQQTIRNHHRKARSMYTQGLRKSRSIPGKQYCVKNMRKRLRRLGF